MSKFGGTLIEDQNSTVSTSRFGGTPVADSNPKRSKEAVDAEALQVARELMALKGKDPNLFQELYGAVRREVEPAAVATLAGAGMGSVVPGIGTGSGALAGLTAYGLSRAAGAFAPIAGLDDPYEKLEEFYTGMGVPDPKSESVNTLRTLFQAASVGPMGIAKGAGKELAKTAARGAAVGASEAVAFETVAEVAEYLGVDQAALPLGIVAAFYTGKKLTPKQVDEIAKTVGSKTSTLEETGKLARKATKSKKAKSELARQFAPDEDVLRAGKELEIDAYLDPDLIAKNRVATEVGQGVRSYAAGSARSAQFENLEQIGNKAQEILEKFGATQDLAGLSNSIKRELRETVRDYDDIANDLYESVNKLIPAGTRGNPEGVLGFLAEKLRKVDGKKEQLTVLERKILKTLSPIVENNKDIFSDIVDPVSKKPILIRGATKEALLPTYDSMEFMRKEIGKGLKRRGEFKNEEVGLLKKLYGLISEDQTKVLEKIPGRTNVAELRKAAKAGVELRKDIEDQIVNLFGSKVNESMFFKLGKETAALTKSDSARFVNLINSIPDEFKQQALVSAMDSTFAKHASSGNLNFASFSKWYNRLKSNKTAHKAFTEALDPEAAKAIDNLAKVSGSIARAKNNVIQTGKINLFNKQIARADNFWSELGERAKKFAVAIPVEYALGKLGAPHGSGLAVGLYAAMSAGKKDRTIDALNKLLIDPDFIRQTRELISTDPNKQKNLIKSIANNKAFARYARVVNLSSQEDRLKFLEDALNPDEEEEN